MPKIKDRDPSFPDRLKRAMMDKGLSQADIAKKIWGTTFEGEYEVPKGRQNIGRYLSGSSYPTIDTRMLLADAIGVSYAELFPNDNKVNLPGSGIVSTQVDKKNVRIDISVVCPNDVGAKLIEIARDYAGTT